MKDADTFREDVIGLRLPDGTEIFPPEKWHGRSLETAEDRKVIFDSLRISASNLGIPEQEMLERYHWLTRTRVTAIAWGDVSQSVPLSETGYVDSTPLPVPAESHALLPTNGEAMETDSAAP